MPRRRAISSSAEPPPDKNRTILNYITPAAARDAQEQEKFDQAIQFVPDVTNDEDYVLGLSIQKGLEAEALESGVFGRNERGNQFFTSASNTT